MRLGVHMEDLVPDGTTGSSSVAADGKTNYMDTEVVGGQVDQVRAYGNSLLVVSVLSTKEEERSLLRMRKEEKALEV